jgi:hypothetical protein
LKGRAIFKDFGAFGVGRPAQIEKRPHKPENRRTDGKLARTGRIFVARMEKRAHGT